MISQGPAAVRALLDQQSRCEEAVFPSKGHGHGRVIGALGWNGRIAAS